MTPLRKAVQDYLVLRRRLGFKLQKAGKALPKRIVTQEGIFPMDVAAKEFPNRKY